MATKSYLYRDDETIFYQLDQLQKLLKLPSQRQAMTAAIVKGLQAYSAENNWEIKEKPEEDTKQQPLFVLTEE